MMYARSSKTKKEDDRCIDQRHQPNRLPWNKFGINLNLGEEPEESEAPFPGTYGELPNRFIPTILFIT